MRHKSVNSSLPFFTGLTLIVPTDISSVVEHVAELNENRCRFGFGVSISLFLSM